MLRSEAETKVGPGEAEFSFESDLGAVIIQHWESTPFGCDYRLLGEFETVRVETGIVDLVAVNEDKRDLLVIEVKRKQASHKKLGQLLRYMGDMAQAWPNYSIKGAIIAQGCKPMLQVALAAVPTVDFYRVEFPFKLVHQQLPEPVASNEAVAYRSHDGVEDAPLLANWDSAPWGKTHDVLEARFEAGREEDPLYLRVVARNRGGTELLVICTSGAEESFPMISKVVLHMGTLMTKVPNMRVTGALVVRSAKPRLQAALRAVPEIELYSFDLPFQLHNQIHTQ